MSSSIATEPQIPRIFIAVCGLSGSGKTAFVDALTSRFPQKFQRAKSVTTRPRREGEGVTEYDFVSAEDFDILARNGQLLNTDLIHQNWYGISADAVRGTISANIVPVKEMAFKNVAQLRHRGFAPLIVEIQSLDPHQVRGSRGKDDALELGQSTDVEIPTVRLVREGQTPAQMAEGFFGWFEAAEVLGAFATAGGSHSPIWETKNRAGYDAIAPEFTDDLRVTTAYFHRLSEPFWANLCQSKIVEGGSYLEVAPGHGWLRDRLQWPSQHGYRGLELSPVMRSCNSHPTDIDLGSATAMPYPGSSFHGVMGSLVDPFLNANFLAEALRVLKPGGWLAFTTPASEWARALRGEAATYQTTFVRSDLSRADVGSACVPPADLHKALASLGFVNIEISSPHVSCSEPDLPPAVQMAFDCLPDGVTELAIVTVCLAEKPR